MASQAPIGMYEPHESAEGAMPRRSVPELSGISTAPGIARIGGALDEIAHQNGAVYASQTMGDARSQFTQRLLDAQTNYKSGDDVVGQIGKDFSAYRDNALKQATNPYARRFLSEQLGELGSQVTQQAMRLQASAQVNDRINKFQDGSQKAAVAVGLAPEQYASALHEQLTGLSQLQIGPEAKSKLYEQTKGQMAWAASEKLATDHPDDVLTALSKPDAGHPALNDLDQKQREELTRFATAQSHDVKKANEASFVENTAGGVLDTYRKGGPGAGSVAYQVIDKADIPPELKDKVRERIAAGINQIHAEAREVHGATIAGVEERISNGTASEKDRATAQWLYHQNAYSADQFGSAMGGIDRAEKEKVSKTADLEAATDAYANGRPMAPNDAKATKGVDQLFQSLTTSLPAGSPEWMNRAIDIAGKTGVVPKSSSEWALANLVSGKPEQAAQGALLIQRFGETSPRGVGFAVGEKERAMALQISDSTKAGTDPVTAVTMARENATLSSTQRQMLDEQWKAKTGFAFGKQTALIDPSWIRSGLSDDPRYNPPGLFSGSVPQPPDQMSAEYAHLVRDYFYHTGGNVDQAQRLAVTDLKSTWGVSEVNGKRELMKYAPEQMFPGLTSDIIHKDIGATLKDAGVETTGAVKLAESPSTASSGGRVWNLTAPDKFGAYDVLRDDEGMPLKYALPDRAAIKNAKLDAQAKQDRADLSKLALEQDRRAQMRAIGYEGTP